jgi:hypothetical protein
MEVVWPIAYRTAQLLENPWRYRRTQELMAVTLVRPMEDCLVVYVIV